MSPVIGNILKFTLSQSFLGQLTQNVLFYRLTAVPTPPDGVNVYDNMLLRINAQIGIAMRNLQSTECTHTIYRVDNLTNGIDFFEHTFNVDGENGGDPAPSFNALNFILRRSTLLTRNGSKRLGGLSEAISSGNTYTGSPSNLAALETAMGTPLLTGDVTPDPFADPVIVGRVLYTPPTGDPYYKLDLSLINAVQSCSFTAVSTQRSRKAGKGV